MTIAQTVVKCLTKLGEKVWKFVVTLNLTYAFYSIVNIGLFTLILLLFKQTGQIAWYLYPLLLNKGPVKLSLYCWYFPIRLLDNFLFSTWDYWTFLQETKLKGHRIRLARKNFLFTEKKKQAEETLSKWMLSFFPKHALEMYLN